MESVAYFARAVSYIHKTFIQLTTGVSFKKFYTCNLLLYQYRQVHLKTVLWSKHAMDSAAYIDRVVSYARKMFKK